MFTFAVFACDFWHGCCKGCWIVPNVFYLIMQLIQGRLNLRKMDQLKLIRSLLKAHYMYHTSKAPTNRGDTFRMLPLTNTLVSHVPWTAVMHLHRPPQNIYRQINTRCNGHTDLWPWGNKTQMVWLSLSYRMLTFFNKNTNLVHTLSLWQRIVFGIITFNTTNINCTIFPCASMFNLRCCPIVHILCCFSVKKRRQNHILCVCDCVWP